MSFRLKGVKNALTLSLLPKNQVGVFEESLSKLSLLKFLTGQRPTLPEPLNSIHSSADSSDKISEDSLNLMFLLLLELVSNYDTMNNSSPSDNESEIK